MGKGKKTDKELSYMVDQAKGGCMIKPGHENQLDSFIKKMENGEHISEAHRDEVERVSRKVINDSYEEPYDDDDVIFG